MVFEGGEGDGWWRYSSKDDEAVIQAVPVHWSAFPGTPPAHLTLVLEVPDEEGVRG